MVLCHQREMTYAENRTLCRTGRLRSSNVFSGSQGDRHRDDLFIAGQVAYGPEGTPIHAGDFRAQARAALQCLKAQVEAGGGTMANIIKVNTYLTDIRHRADYGPIREEFFGKKMPAHTLVAVTALAAPEFLIEIEAVAVL